MSSTWLGDAASAIPLGYACGAGMVTAVNPCGFAMLPAYLGLYLGTGGSENTRDTTVRRIRQVLVVSLRVLQAPPPPATFAGHTQQLEELPQKLTQGEDVAISAVVQGLGGPHHFVINVKSNEPVAQTQQVAIKIDFLE